MAVRYNKSTYKTLIDDILLDVNEAAHLSGLGPEIYVGWILRAEEAVCKEIEISEEYILRHQTDVDEYPVQDRPLITGASLTSPITITCPAHGIPDYSRVLIVDILGNTAANGRWFTSGAATNTFIINPGAYIASVKEVTAGLQITTETEHGFSNGASITLNGTPADGTHVITLIDDFNFTIPVGVADPTYNGGGVALWLLQSTGNGTYTSGGRVWVDTEIPTYFDRFTIGQRKFGTLPLNVSPASFYDVRRYQELDGYAVHSSYCAPTDIAPFNRSGIKYFKLWPMPKNHGDLTLTGRLLISPGDFRDDADTLNIHLWREYDELIKAWVMSKVYNWLKSVDPERRAQFAKDSDNKMREFFGLVDQKRAMGPKNPARPMVYE